MEPRYAGRRRDRWKFKATAPAWIAVLLLGVAVPRASASLTNEALMDSLQHSAFRFFWEQANPTNGLIKDRSASWSPCSIASTGFGLSAICIGVDHGWVSRADAAARVRTTYQVRLRASEVAADLRVGALVDLLKARLPP